MLKIWFLKIHRWAALAFSLPLMALFITGLILSFVPIIDTASIKPNSVSVEKITGLLAKADPQDKTRALFIRPYENTVSIGAGRGGGMIFDLFTGQELKGADNSLSAFMASTRRIHEHLWMDELPLVVVSTFIMLGLIIIGTLLGWPKFSNSLAGWHKGTAWVLLPLLVLSPLTGLFMAYGINFNPPAPATANKAPAPTVMEAVKLAANAGHDLSAVNWIRQRGSNMMMRINNGGEYQTYNIRKEGLTLTPRNWPRLWHEGTFAGVWSGVMNVIISLASILLLITGVWIWARRTLRIRKNRAARLQNQAA